MGEFSPELSFLIRETQVKQEWLREFLIYEGHEELKFVGTANTNSNPWVVAREISTFLGITSNDQRSCKTRDDALKLWIRKAESAGIYVFRRGDVTCEEARGFVLCDSYAPFIFLNSKDGKAAQMFTLAHEMAHLWINESGVSNLVGYYLGVDQESTGIEIFCNKIAAEAVLDSAIFDHQWKSQERDNPLENRIEQLSSIFKVSEEVIARRLLEKQVISSTKYQQLREKYRERWLEYERHEKAAHKENKHHPSPHLLKVINNGYAFTQTILGAYYSGIASVRETSALLGVKINHLSKIAERAFPFAQGTR